MTEGRFRVTAPIAAGDTRVHPAHARKFVARLQAEASGGPFLLRTVRETGHGVGTPTEVRVRTNLDQWAFVWDQLGVDPEDPS